MHKRGFDLSLLDSVIEQLKDGKKLNEKFKEHLLSGEFAGFHECHIKPDWLFIYHNIKEDPHNDFLNRWIPL